MISALAFVVFSLVCTVLAFRRHPIFGLYFYMATTYIHPPSRWWGYLLPDLRWAFLSAAITILAVLLHRGRLEKRPPWLSSPVMIILCLYAGWMWIQSLWALDLPTHFDGSILLTKYLVASWFIYRTADTKDGLRKMLTMHALGCAMLGVLAHFTGREDGRLEGVGGPGIDDANTLGMFLATGVVVCMGLFMTIRGWRRWPLLILLACALEGFVLANSRGALLGLAAGAVVLMFCKAREHRRTFWVLAMIGALGFGIAVDQTFVERMFTIGDVTAVDEDADMSARSRVAIYEAQLRMAQDYPQGAGHRGTVVLSTQYLDRKWLVGGGAADDAARASHNTFMTALVEQGIVGAVLFGGVVVWLLLTAWRLRRMNLQGADPDLITLGATMIAGVFVVIVAGVATDYLLAEIQYWLLGGLVSLLQLVSRAATDKAPVADTTALATH